MRLSTAEMLSPTIIRLMPDYGCVEKSPKIGWKRDIEKTALGMVRGRLLGTDSVFEFPDPKGGK
jgi:hypothetical protein